MQPEMPCTPYSAVGRLCTVGEGAWSFPNAAAAAAADDDASSVPSMTTDTCYRFSTPTVCAFPIPSLPIC